MRAVTCTRAKPVCSPTRPARSALDERAEVHDRPGEPVQLQDEQALGIPSAGAHDAGQIARTLCSSQPATVLAGIVTALTRRPEQHENGKFAWIMDPDGNKVELWEPMNWDEKKKKP